MREQPRYLLIAALGVAVLAAIACTFAIPFHVEIVRQPLKALFFYVAAPIAETISFTVAFYLLFGLTRRAVLHVIATLYRVLFSTMPGAGKLKMMQDGLLWIAPDHQIRYLAV